MSDERPLVLVTGGSGMLGRRLLGRLRPDHRLVSLDLEGDPESAPDVEFICTDLTSEESIGRALDRVRRLHGDHVASVVHLAAYYDFAGRPSPLYREVTVEGTERLVRALRTMQVDQFVFSSTMLVHRPSEPGDPIDESEPLAEDTWPYPQSKIETEQRLRDAAGDVHTVVLRIAGVYDEMGHSPPLTNQIKRIHGGWLTSHFYPADLDRGQAFVHLDDVVDALARTVAARDRLEPHEVFLIGEPSTMSYGELQDLIATQLRGRPWSTWEIPVWAARLGAWVRERNPLQSDPFIRSWMVDRASDHYELDVSRAREVLGWEARHRVREVIPEMLDRLQDDPAGWYGTNSLEPPRRAAA